MTKHNDRALLESFDSEPYPINLVRKDGSFNYEFVADSGETYRVQFYPSNGLGPDVRRVYIGQKKGSIFKDVMTKFADPMRIVSTMLAAFDQFLQTPAGKGTHGFVIDATLKAFGPSLRILRRLVSRHPVIRQRFSVMDSTWTWDKSRAPIWVIRKGKNPAEVFSGKNVDIAALTGVVVDKATGKAAPPGITQQDLDDMDRVAKEDAEYAERRKSKDAYLAAEAKPLEMPATKPTLDATSGKGWRYDVGRGVLEIKGAKVADEVPGQIWKDARIVAYSDGGPEEIFSKTSRLNRQDWTVGSFATIQATQEGEIVVYGYTVDHFHTKGEMVQRLREYHTLWRNASKTPAGSEHFIGNRAKDMFVSTTGKGVSVKGKAMYGTKAARTQETLIPFFLKTPQDAFDFMNNHVFEGRVKLSRTDAHKVNGDHMPTLAYMGNFEFAGMKFQGLAGNIHVKGSGFSYGYPFIYSEDNWETVTIGSSLHGVVTRFPMKTLTTIGDFLVLLGKTPVALEHGISSYGNGVFYVAPKDGKPSFYHVQIAGSDVKVVHKGEVIATIGTVPDALKVIEEDIGVEQKVAPVSGGEAERNRFVDFYTQGGVVQKQLEEIIDNLDDIDWNGFAQALRGAVGSNSSAGEYDMLADSLRDQVENVDLHNDAWMSFKLPFMGIINYMNAAKTDDSIYELRRRAVEAIQRNLSQLDSEGEPLMDDDTETGGGYEDDDEPADKPTAVEPVPATSSPTPSPIEKLYDKWRREYHEKEYGQAYIQVTSYEGRVKVSWDITERRTSRLGIFNDNKGMVNSMNSIVSRLKAEAEAVGLKAEVRLCTVDRFDDSDREYSEYEQAIGGGITITA